MPGVVESECYGKERSGRTRGRSGAGIHSLRCRGLVASIEPRGDYLGLAEHGCASSGTATPARQAAWSCILWTMQS